MRRTYNRERYLDRVAMIREHVPDCSLTTDIIVGFPGETEADFEETLEVVEEVRYDSAFTFIFSPRRGTEAADAGRTSCRTRSSASAWSGSWRLVQRRATERAQRFVGRTMEVLVEGPSRTDPSRLRGRTRHNKTVNFAGLAPRRASSPRCEISRATSTTLAGEEQLLSPARLASSPAEVARGRSGPTGLGKTAVAIALADLLRARGEDPVAISATRSRSTAALEILSRRGRRRASSARLEHRLRRVRARRASDVLAPASSRRSAHARDRPRAGRGPAADRGGRHRPLSARGAHAASTCSRRRPARGDGRAGPRRSSGAGRGAAPAELLERAPAVERRSRQATAAASCARSSCWRWAELEPGQAEGGDSQLWTEDTRRPTLLAGLD